MSSSEGPKEPSRPTVKRLFALSGNRCAFPKCDTPLVDPQSGSIVGEICHIKGEKPGAARHDPNQSNEERHGFDNLILLCNLHHKIADDDDVAYTVERLVQMKAVHETRHNNPPPVDDAIVERFVTAAITNSTIHGSVVTTHGQIGGQAAHSITNYYGGPTSGQSSSGRKASLTVEFADTVQEVSLGDRIKWTAEFCRTPDTKEIPKLGDRPSQIDHPLLGKLQIPEMPDLDLHSRLNRWYYHELAEFEFAKRLFRKVRLVVSNTSDVPASDVRIEMSIPTNQGITILKPWKFPAVPKRRIDTYPVPVIRNIGLRRAFGHPGDLDIEENEHQFKIEVDCGSLQPGRKVWSGRFYIGIGSSGEAKLAGCILAENLPGPQDFSLTVDADVCKTEMTVRELMSLNDPVDEDA